MQSPERSAMAIKVLSSNFRSAEVPHARLRKDKWAPPTSDCVKINVDASFNPDMLRGTTGAVIRDKKGKFIAAYNARLDIVQDVLSAEALALKHGLSLAESMGCNRVVMSSDNNESIEIMTNERPPTGIAAAILHDCFLWSQNLLGSSMSMRIGNEFCSS